MATLNKMDVLAVIALLLCSAVDVYADHRYYDDDEYEHKIETRYMLDLFGKVVDISEDGEMILKLSPSDYYWNNVECQTTIRTAPNHELMFYFKEVKLADHNDWIKLYGESISPSNAISNGCSKTGNVLTTEGNSGILKFHSNSMGCFGGFEIHISSYYSPQHKMGDHDDCMPGYYKCKKDRCVKNNLKCNTRDNCGDDSDEPDDCDYRHAKIKLIMKIVGGVLGLIGLTATVTIIICCCVSKKKPTVSKGKVHATNPGWTATATLSTTDTKVPLPQGPDLAFTKVPLELSVGPIVSSDIPAPPEYSPPITEKY